MPLKQRDVYTSRYTRNGTSYCVTIPPDLRERMGLLPGDMMAMNYQHGVLWVVKITPGMIVTRERVAQIFDELFPDREGKHASQ